MRAAISAFLGARGASETTTENRSWERFPCGLTTTCQPVAARGGSEFAWPAQIRDLSSILAAATSIREAITRILESLCINLGWQFGGFWQVDSDNNCLHCTEIWTRSPAKEFEKLSRRTVFSPGVGLPGRVWATQKPHWIPDLRADANFPRIAAATTDGIRSGFALPIVHAANVLGVLEFFSSETTEADTSWMQMFESIGGQIGQFMVRVQYQEAVQASKHMLETVLSNIPQGVFWKDRQSRIMGCNTVVSRAFGVAQPQQLIGKTDYDLQGVNPAQAANFIQKDREVMTSGQAILGIIEPVTLADGATIWLETNKMPLRDSQGQVAGILGTWQDVTERKSLEEQLRQSQKMEAIGQLAGGVAHDFNNLLTVINGYAEVVMASMPASDPHKALLAEVMRAGNRAAELTGQLLAFSRKSILAPKVLDLNEAIEKSQRMLRRVIGEDVLLVTAFGSPLNRVKVDPSQIEQVVMNLAVNARDAMPQGGALTISTCNIDLDEESCQQYPGCKPGSYVALAINDTGCGMTPEVKARIFEPFFTTKEVGKGTGLGLATVYGIVKQSEGYIAVDSTVGAGTTFTVFLPAVMETQVSTQPDHADMAVRRGNETILLVEDEDNVRRLARLILEAHGYTVLEAHGYTVLEAHGYTVLEARGGREAMELEKAHAGPIHLLITDVVMPRMSGRSLAEAILHRYPGLKVLYMSGYTDDAVVRHGIAAQQDAFLHKPFSLPSLAKKVREVLDN